MSSDDTDELIARFRDRIVAAERQNASAASALIAELAQILAARAIAAAARTAPSPTPAPAPSRYALSREELKP